MPSNLVHNKTEEKWWDQAKKMFEESKGRSPREKNDKDWGLVNYLFQRVKDKKSYLDVYASIICSSEPPRLPKREIDEVHKSVSALKEQIKIVSDVYGDRYPIWRKQFLKAEKSLDTSLLDLRRAENILNSVYHSIELTI